jgi:hypothetical protein
MFLVLAVVCLFIVYGTVVVAERRAIGEVDRKFLDDIVRQQSQDADTLSAPERNMMPCQSWSSVPMSQAGCIVID